MKLIMKIFLLMFLLVIVACQESEEVAVSEINKTVENTEEVKNDEDDEHDEDKDHEHEDKEHEHDEDKDHEHQEEAHDEDKDHEHEDEHEHDEDKDHEHEEEVHDDEHEIIEFLEVYNVPGIENLLDLSWPREVEAMNGSITIDEKPERILTISTGHDEMIFGFANLNNIVGVTSFSQSPGGNIYELTKDMPTITSEIETIVAQNPDIVFADPYANPNLMQSLVELGITVVQTQLNNTSEGRINDILFAAYVLDELEGSMMLIDAINEQIEFIEFMKSNIGSSDLDQDILSVTYYDAYWAAGTGSTEGSIIELAGYNNIASEKGVESNNMITKESLIDMSPDVIAIPQSVEWGGQDFYDTLMSDVSFTSIPAVVNEKVFMVNTSHFTTLSHFNILGSIDLIDLIEPNFFDDVERPVLKACYQCYK
jgi:ABC-type Fe3+-hydroxamate transport system substrate-binding protein